MLPSRCRAIVQAIPFGARSYARIRPRFSGRSANIARSIPESKQDLESKDQHVSRQSQPLTQDAADTTSKIFQERFKPLDIPYYEDVEPIDFTGPNPPETPTLARQPPPASSSFSQQRVTSLPPLLFLRSWDVAPPTVTSLRESRSFFTSHPSTKIFSSPTLLGIPFTETPEIAFLGRSNVGKSSLINALLGKKLAKSSSRPGKTKAISGYSLGGKVTVLDMPGFGRGSREEWGKEVGKYLEKRKVLKRVFVIIDALKGFVSEDDKVMLNQLSEMGIPHQIIVGKIDRILFPTGGKIPPSRKDCEQRLAALNKVMDNIHNELWPPPDPTNPNSRPRPFGQILAVAAENPRWARYSDEKNGAIGLDAVRWAILVATGLDRSLPSVIREKGKMGSKVVEVKKKKNNGEMQKIEKPLRAKGFVQSAKRKNLPEENPDLVLGQWAPGKAFKQHYPQRNRETSKQSVIARQGR